MAKQNFSLYTPRDKPKKRPGKHKKSLSKSEKNNNNTNTNTCHALTILPLNICNIIIKNTIRL